MNCAGLRPRKYIWLWPRRSYIWLSKYCKLSLYRTVLVFGCENVLDYGHKEVMFDSQNIVTSYHINLLWSSAAKMYFMSSKRYRMSVTQSRRVRMLNDVLFPRSIWIQNNQIIKNGRLHKYTWVAHLGHPTIFVRPLGTTSLYIRTFLFKIF